MENPRPALRYDRLGFIAQSLLQAACLFLVAGRLVSELWQPPLNLDAVAPFLNFGTRTGTAGPVRACDRSPGGREAMYGNGGHGVLWTALYYLIAALVALFFLLAKTGQLALPW